MKKIIGGLLTAAAAVCLLTGQVSAEEQSEMRWGYTPDGCYYQESSYNDECSFRFEKGEDCRFSCQWDECRQCYAELGLKLPGIIRIGDINDFYISYEAEMYLTGNNYFGLHCKMRDLPGKNVTREIYTVEAWGSWRPSGTLLAKEYLAGREYEYYSINRINQPTVEGVRDCEQYWCVRTYSAGTLYRQANCREDIPIDKHLQTLQQVGVVSPDEMPESAALYVECWDGTSGGFLNVLKAEYHIGYHLPVTTAPLTTTVTTVSTTARKTQTTTPVPKKTADADGCYFRSDFENGSDRWQTRGRARLRQDTNNYVDGRSSLLVTGRDSSESGVSFLLTPYAVEPERSYSVRICVMQKAEEIMGISLYCDMPDINTVYLTEAWAVRGQWTVLECTFPVTHFIPDGNEILRLHVQADSPEADFYVDAAGFWDEGCMPEADLSGAVSDFVPYTVQHTVSDDGLELRRHQNDAYSYVCGGGGLKDLLGPYFRAGFCASAGTLQDPEKQALYRKHCNAVSCRTELLPETVIREIGENGVTVSLEEAAPVLQFAAENGLGFRGSALVNGSSMPEEMLSGSRAEREMRLESLIRETFAQLEADYPSLDLYAYDVCRNVIPQENDPYETDPEETDPEETDPNETGQEETSAETESAWAALPEEERTAYIIAAFRYARKYAPVNCKLFLSAENLFSEGQQEAVYALVGAIRDAGDDIDGIAVQAHLSEQNELFGFEETLMRLSSMNLDIQITELRNSSGPDEYLPFEMPDALLVAAAECAEVITSVTFYEPFCGEWEGMKSECCLFDRELQPEILLLNLPGSLRSVSVYDVEALVNISFYPQPYLIGDLDGSGETDYDDALLLLRFLTEDDGGQLSEQAQMDADLNWDGQITLIDLCWLLLEIRQNDQNSG